MSNSRIQILMWLSLGCHADKDRFPTPIETDTGDVQTNPVDNDRDGSPEDEDCNDDNSLIFPGAEERCDGIDNDCDGDIDEGLSGTYYVDEDGDGYGDMTAPIQACEQPSGTIADGSDCNDNDADIHPEADEICDEVDNDCDGEIDEGDATDASTWYADVDGDGFGSWETQINACEAPTGHVSDSNDCDDGNDAIYPEATEVCDEVDNDCDGDIDEEDAADVITWYADADGDGYGDGDTTAESCDRITGYVYDDNDCDDNDATIFPTAIEVCDEIDNDCDGDIDDEDSSVRGAPTWHADSDGDGWGDAAVSTSLCDQPSGYVVNDTDCDDADDSTHPGASEICDDVDNDCDGVIDEGVESIWYVDADADGYGDSSTALSDCEAPSGYVDNRSDCDDADEDIYPGATEVCDETDNDCDGVVDEGVETVWYPDSDADGFGDESAALSECEAPSGYVDNRTDCDDDDEDINPDATEVCDEVDNDCDGEVDERSAADATTWYADVDGDGLGDPDTAIDACEAPSGFVDNADDCDDLSADDIDGDGIADCEDDDIDGDGLRNEWDADPEDGSVVRGPSAGLGADGDWSLSTDVSWSEWTELDGGASAGDDEVDADDTSGFAEGDEILIISLQGTDAGQYQLVFVSSVSTSSLSIEPPLDVDFDSSSVVAIQRVPHYEDVEIDGSASVSTTGWADGGTGIVAFRAKGDVTLDGAIDVSGLGFEGGDGVYGNSYSPLQGESWSGTGNYGNTNANEGGGGAYPRRDDQGDSGGGGGFGTEGDEGTCEDGSTVTSGGDTYGDDELVELFLGSGGGGGSPDKEGDGNHIDNYSGNGGNGGGMVLISAGGTLTINGSVLADGNDGDDAYSPWYSTGENGGGGAGSGGTIYLASPVLTISGTVSAEGGGGGSSASYNAGTPYGSAFGGDGGDGRIRLDSDSISGATNPSAGHTDGWPD